MKIIGITGGVGSGKSTIANLLKEEFNAKLFIADDIAKEFMEKGKESYIKVVEYFGKDILDKDDNINRKLLADIVFSDKEKLQKLNSFTHETVVNYLKLQIENLKKENTENFIVIETALMKETNVDKMCDEVWYIYTNEDIRRERIKKSRNYTDEKIDNIIRNQKSDEYFRQFCTKEINNNQTIDKILKQIKFLLGN